MKSQAGFTVPELLVVIALSAFLSAIAISYTNTGQRQVSLSIEAAKISQLMLQAKELSIATYSKGSICAYGVSFDFLRQQYSLFAYTPPGAPPCPPASSIAGFNASSAIQYSPESFAVPIARGVQIRSTAPNNDVLAAVLFYPPTPTIFISRDGATFMSPAQTSRVYLTTTDNSASTTISVNPAGQIGF